jgi:hypothetical protein
MEAIWTTKQAHISAKLKKSVYEKYYKSFLISSFFPHAHILFQIYGDTEAINFNFAKPVTFILI